MGIAYYCNRERGITYSVWDGAICKDDWAQHILAQLSDSEWGASNLWLSDQTSITQMENLELTVIAQQAERFRGVQKALGYGRIALIATQQFEQMRKVSAAMDRMQVTVIVFNALDTACLYLGLEEAHTRLILSLLRAELRRRDPQPVGLKVDLDQVLLKSAPE